MILSYNDLWIKVLAPKVMTGVSPLHVNAASIDVTLASTILVETDARSGVWPNVISLRERQSPSFTEIKLGEDHAFRLRPGQFILAATAERFNLPLNMSAEFRLKSSAGRMGLSHALAVWCDPGWNGSALTLELHNITRFHEIELRAGDRIGQMIFHEHAPVPEEAGYGRRGSYNGDLGVQPAKGRP